MAEHGQVEVVRGLDEFRSRIEITRADETAAFSRDVLAKADPRVLTVADGVITITASNRTVRYRIRDEIAPGVVLGERIDDEAPDRA